MDNAHIDTIIVDTLGMMKGHYSYDSVKNDVFEQHIKSFLHKLNNECKAKGWKHREKLVRYEHERGVGKCFCLISPQSHILLSLGKLDLRQYIKLFEDNKNRIRKEALKFVTDYPLFIKKFDKLIADIMENMIKRPAFIEKNQLKHTVEVKNHEIVLTITYRTWSIRRYFDLYHSVDSYKVSTICRSMSHSIMQNVMIDLAGYVETRGKQITKAEEDALVKYYIKIQEPYCINTLLDNAKNKISVENREKLQAVLTALSLIGQSKYYYS